MLKIITVPNPILTTPVKKVERFDGSLKKLVKDMDQTLTAQVNPQGVGLAAPQVGCNEALFIIKPAPNAKTEVFINPRIVKISQSQLKSVKVSANNKPISTKSDLVSTKSDLVSTDSTDSKRTKTKLEGCLSIPKIWGSVKRVEKIKLEFQDLQGTKHKETFSGFNAYIIQHEIDHLNGILFTQRALEQNSPLYEEKEGELKKVASI